MLSLFELTCERFWKMLPWFRSMKKQNGSVPRASDSHCILVKSKPNAMLVAARPYDASGNGSRWENVSLLRWHAERSSSLKAKLRRTEFFVFKLSGMNASILLIHLNKLGHSETSDILSRYPIVVSALSAARVHRARFFKRKETF